MSILVNKKSPLGLLTAEMVIYWPQVSVHDLRIDSEGPEWLFYGELGCLLIDRKLIWSPDESPRCFLGHTPPKRRQLNLLLLHGVAQQWITEIKQRASAPNAPRYTNSYYS